MRFFTVFGAFGTHAHTCRDNYYNIVTIFDLTISLISWVGAACHATGGHLREVGRHFAPLNGKAEITKECPHPFPVVETNGRLPAGRQVSDGCGDIRRWEVVALVEQGDVERLCQGVRRAIAHVET